MTSSSDRGHQHLYPRTCSPTVTLLQKRREAGHLQHPEHVRPALMFSSSRQSPAAGGACGSTATTHHHPAATPPNRCLRIDVCDHDKESFGGSSSSVALKSWSPPNASYRQRRYVNRPASIENYEPGQSSVTCHEHISCPLYNPPVDKPGDFCKYTESPHLKYRIRKRNRSCSPSQADPSRHEQYQRVQKGGDIPFNGLRPPTPPRTAMSEWFGSNGTKQPTMLPSSRSAPCRVNSNEEELLAVSPLDVSGHSMSSAVGTANCRSVRDEINAARKLELELVLAEERRKRHEEDERINQSRRHSAYFVHTSGPVSLDRFNDDVVSSPPRVARPRPRNVRSRARAIYNFQAQNSRELTLHRGDIVYLLRAVNENWFEGEHHGLVGIFPTNYVEVIVSIEEALLANSDNEALVVKAVHDFQPRSPAELPLCQGDVVTVLRQLDDNWCEGRARDRQGIFPTSYVQVVNTAGEESQFRPTSSFDSQDTTSRARCHSTERPAVSAVSSPVHMITNGARRRRSTDEVLSSTARPEQIRASSVLPRRTAVQQSGIRQMCHYYMQGDERIVEPVAVCGNVRNVHQKIYPAGTDAQCVMMSQCPRSAECQSQHLQEQRTYFDNKDESDGRRQARGNYGDLRSSQNKPMTLQTSVISTSDQPDELNSSLCSAVVHHRNIRNERIDPKGSAGIIRSRRGSRELIETNSQPNTLAQPASDSVRTVASLPLTTRPPPKASEQSHQRQARNFKGDTFVGEDAGSQPRTLQPMTTMCQLAQRVTSKRWQDEPAADFQGEFEADDEDDGCERHEVYPQTPTASLSSLCCIEDNELHRDECPERSCEEDIANRSSADGEELKQAMVASETSSTSAVSSQPSSSCWIEDSRGLREFLGDETANCATGRGWTERDDTCEYQARTEGEYGESGYRSRSPTPRRATFNKQHPKNELENEQQQTRGSFREDVNKRGSDQSRQVQTHQSQDTRGSVFLDGNRHHTSQLQKRDDDYDEEGTMRKQVRDVVDAFRVCKLKDSKPAAAGKLTASTQNPKTSTPRWIETFSVDCHRQTSRATEDIQARRATAANDLVTVNADCQPVTSHETSIEVYPESPEITIFVQPQLGQHTEQMHDDGCHRTFERSNVHGTVQSIPQNTSRPQYLLVGGAGTKQQQADNLISFTPCYAISAYTARRDDELSIVVGDVVYVTESFDDGWCVGISQRTNDVGAFPANFVRRLDAKQA